MFARLLTCVALACLCGPTTAQPDPDLTCHGTTPAWQLQLSDNQAKLTFHQRSTRFDIPHFTAAEGRNWPRAYSLVADFDTAIVLIDQSNCALNSANYPITAHILTQRSQTPIVLTGCCEARP